MINDVSLEIIQKCLNNCVHCSSNSRHNSQAILEIHAIEEVIDDIVELGAKRLCLSGGEPFLHTDIINIIRYAVQKGLKLDIYSSGIVGEYGKEEALGHDMLLECKKAGLNRIMFNLQAAHSEVYDSIMGTTNNFPLVIESIKRAKRYNIETEIHFVPMKQNTNEVKDVVKLAKELGACCVSFLRLVPHGRAKLNMENIMLTDNELRSIQEELYAIKEGGEKIRIGLPLSFPGDTSHCHAVKEKLYIKFDGSVFGCEAFKYIQFLDDKNVPITPDNVLKRRIKDINSKSLFLEKSIDLVEKFSNMKCGCDNCPVQKYLKEKDKNV